MFDTITRGPSDKQLVSVTAGAKQSRDAEGAVLFKLVLSLSCPRDSWVAQPGILARGTRSPRNRSPPERSLLQSLLLLAAEVQCSKRSAPAWTTA